MWLPLLVSSLIAGIVGTTVMLPLFYLPRLWGRRGYDVLGALGSAMSGELNVRSRVAGVLAFYAGGVIFALLYGLLAYTLILFGVEDGGVANEEPWALPLDATIAFPILGLVMGLAHGGVVALLLTIVVVEHHPLARYRRGMEMAFPALLTHPVFGLVVMLTHRAVLEAWLP